jgi:hypothetical protein
VGRASLPKLPDGSGGTKGEKNGQTPVRHANLGTLCRSTKWPPKTTNHSVVLFAYPDDNCVFTVKTIGTTSLVVTTKKLFLVRVSIIPSTGFTSNYHRKERNNETVITLRFEEHRLSIIIIIVVVLSQYFCYFCVP